VRAEQIEEVWGMLERERLALLAHQGPEPVFATISGAHLYGFASPDSDVDLRGAFLLPVRAMLGLHAPRETLELDAPGPVEIDWVAHDLRKFARLLTGHNGYALEQLYSPLVVVTTPAHRELAELARGCVTRPTVHHYQGFARGRRKRLHEPDPTVKHLLYAYRVLLTGIHLMQSGEVVSNLPLLNERFRRTEIDGLIERKRAGAERMRLDAAELEAHERVLDGLEQELAQAHARSSLPEEPQGVPALEDFVVRTRLAAAAGA
jgi:predicted nucleotidyltransferase